MNNDCISNTPGGEHILLGGIVLGLSVAVWFGLQYQLGTIGKLGIAGISMFGAVQLGRGLYRWKYTDRKTFRDTRKKQNLLIDIPITETDKRALHAVEDALIELIRVSKTVDIEMHSIDTANNVGTIRLVGGNADAMFAHVYATLARFAKSGGMNLFPPQGQDIDTETHGKRVMLIVAKGRDF